MNWRGGSESIEVSQEIVKTERLGRIRTDGKLRPLRMYLTNTQTRKMALKNATQIRKNPVMGAKFDPRTVFICPNLTKQQRDADIEHRKQSAEKRKDDPNWIIQKGRIIRRSRTFPVDPVRVT